MIWLILTMTAYVTVTLVLIVFTKPILGPRVLWSAWLWPLTLVQTLYWDWKAGADTVLYERR